MGKGEGKGGERRGERGGEESQQSHICLDRGRSEAKREAPQFETFPHFISVPGSQTLKS